MVIVHSDQGANTCLFRHIMACNIANKLAASATFTGSSRDTEKAYILAAESSTGVSASGPKITEAHSMGPSRPVPFSSYEMLDVG